MAGTRWRVPPSTWLLRLAMVAGPLGSLACAAPSGHPPSLPTYGVATALGVVWALRPESPLGTVLLAGVVLWWVHAVDAALPAGALPAAALLTTAHVAGLLADLGPARMALHRDVARLWAGRAGLAVLCAAALWLLARAVDDTSTPGVWVLALAVGTVVAAGTAVALGRTRET